MAERRGTPLRATGPMMRRSRDMGELAEMVVMGVWQV